MNRLLLLPAAALMIGAAAAPAELDVNIEQVRNARGVLHLCLTRSPAHFPDCSKDPLAMKRSVPAATRDVRFDHLAPGRYAVTVFHDENNNRKLDTTLGIPREGFAFSRNPKVRFGAPRFSQVDIELASGMSRYALRMQYIL
jgi:uncharacterized protein (DUF2141 family)